jgi:hypothetical protein
MLQSTGHSGLAAFGNGSIEDLAAAGIIHQPLTIDYY